METSEWIEGTILHVWAERDRLHVCIADRSGETIAEWWDDEARALVEDGFMRHHEDHEGLVAYCKSLGLIKNVCEVYNIDAWRDEGGWYENDRRGLTVYPNVPEEPRALFAWMRRKGLLSEYSKGRVEYDAQMGWVCQRSDHMPLFGIQPLDC